MADLTQHADLPTVQAIYQAYERARSKAHRPHLGGSQIGHHCDRFLWYQFRWADHDEPDGRVLRLFDHGNWEEKRMVADLRATGATVYELDPDTGRQFTFTAFGGHFGISIDGACVRLPESSVWHILEFKTHNERSFSDLQRHGVEKSKPQHADQCQVGMELADLDRALYLAVNKNTDTLYGERLRRDPKRGEQLLDRAERVIFSEDPLERVSDRPDWWQCKTCPMYQICHQSGTAEVNCRTCVHSTPMRDGTWHCAKHDQTLTTKEQRAGCDRHLMRPDLVGHGEAVDAGDDWIEYTSARGTFWNGVEKDRGVYLSSELRAATALPLDQGAEDMRAEFDGTIEG